MGMNIKKNRWFLKAILWFLGIWAVSIAAIEVLLSTPLVTNTVNKYAAEYIDGNISFGKVSGSMFSNFPSMTLTLEDFCITYPSDRFDKVEKRGPQGALLYRGNGSEADTLASFARFTASARVLPLLTGHLDIPRIELNRPKIYAHSYQNGQVNWDIFKIADSPKDTTDTSSFKMPEIGLGEIRLTDQSEITYTSSRDTIFAMVELKGAGFDGRLLTDETVQGRLGLSVDSLFLAGRIASDTLAVGIDLFRIHEHEGHADIELKAKSLVATRSFGRLNVPIDISCTAHFPEDSVLAVGVHDLKAEIAAVPIIGEADMRFLPEKVEIDGNLSVTDCKVNDIIQEFVRKFIPEAGKIETDAVIGIEATCSGDYIYKNGRLPIFRVDLTVPESRISHSDLGEEMRVTLDASLANTRRGAFNVNINDISVKTSGLDLNGYGGVTDLLSDDPEFTLDGSISASLDSLMRFVPDTLNMKASGKLLAEVSGTANLSHLSLYTFSKSELNGKLTSNNLVFQSPDDSIDVTIRDLEIGLGPETVTSQRDTSQSFRLIGVSGKLGRINASYGSSIKVLGDNVAVSAKSASDGADTNKVNRLGGRFSARSLSLTDAAGTSVEIDNTENGFQMMPQRRDSSVPVLTLTSDNKRITLVTDLNRAILTDASIEARAGMTTVESRMARSGRERGARSARGGSRVSSRSRQQSDVPVWMSEDDFRKQDIDIRLDQSLAKYFREWDMRGNIDIRTGIVMTPYFPLRNILRGVEVSFTNDNISIDSLKVVSGNSSIEAKGELTGLRRALTGRGRNAAPLNLDLNIRTDGMNANQILTAYNTGSRFNPEMAKDNLSEVSDAEFLKMVTSDTTAIDEGPKLIVIPGNLNANISIDGNDISYSDLDISSFNARMQMRERCIQITNTLATSNIGNVSFEGFYATRTKQDIKAGFNFEFKDITAEKAIGLMPAVDSIMPLLKSFSGLLNCELAATASLDTNMNILTPTINGVLRISGDDLTVSNSDMFSSLAKKLKFNDRETGSIKHMTVEGVIQDNVLEVFPFVLSLDRYTLALSGKQNLDMSYRYHASIIKSPILIKVGVDVYGPDFNNMKFKIGRPKYKNENVPVFTAVIDETRINLAESIRGIFEKGVEAAVRENERQDAIRERRKGLGYVNAVDQETEELSQEEQKALDESTAEETVTTENNQ